MAYYARCVWYALVPVLLGPLAWRVVAGDLSLVPDYLGRVVILAALVNLVRAAMMRSREGYADGRAAAVLGVGVPLTRLVERQPAAAGPAWMRIISWDPAPDTRRSTLENPSSLGRLAPTDMLAVGVTAAWTVPLLRDLLSALSFLTPVQAAQLLLILVFGLVGVYCGVVVVRAVVTSIDPASIAGTVLGLGAGLCAGVVLSLGNTGLGAHAGGDLAAAALIAALIGAVLATTVDLRQATVPPPSSDRRVWAALAVAVATIVFALAADAVVVASEFVRLNSASFLAANLPEVLAGGSAAAVFAGALVAVSAVVSATARRGRQLRPTLGVGTAMGALGSPARRPEAALRDPGRRNADAGEWSIPRPAPSITIDSDADEPT